MKTKVLLLTLPEGIDPADVQHALSTTEISISSPSIQFEGPRDAVFSCAASFASKDSKAKESQPEELPDTGLAISGGSTHDTGYDRVQLWLAIYREQYINGNNQVGRRNKDAEEAANLAVDAFDRKFS